MGEKRAMGAVGRGAGRVRWGWASLALISFAAVAAAQPSGLSGAMLTFHDRLRSARDALVFADVDSFRTWVQALAGAEPPLSAFPQAQRGYAKQVRVLAARGAKARGFGEASATLGQLAGQCGGCHSSAGQAPEYPRESPATEGSSFDDHMERHRWALERLWEGLTTGNERIWRAGVGQLREPSLTLEELPEAARNPTVTALARKMHGVGERAEKASTPAERAKLVGELVEVCGRCHAASGVRGL